MNRSIEPGGGGGGSGIGAGRGLETLRAEVEQDYLSTSERVARSEIFIRELNEKDAAQEAHRVSTGSALLLTAIFTDLAASLQHVSPVASPLVSV